MFDDMQPSLLLYCVEDCQEITWRPSTVPAPTSTCHPIHPTSSYPFPDLPDPDPPRPDGDHKTASPPGPSASQSPPPRSHHPYRPTWAYRPISLALLLPCRLSPWRLKLELFGARMTRAIDELRWLSVQRGQGQRMRSRVLGRWAWGGGTLFA